MKFNFFSILASASIAIVLSGCSRSLSESEKRELASLKQTLTSVQSEISVAEQKSKAGGGLLAALAGSRVEILKTTRDLTEQRIAALESGASINVVIPATNIDNDLAQKIEVEIKNVEQRIDIARKEAENSSGLFGAIRATAVATHEVTLAQLHQKYLTAKYGLAALPVALKSNGAPTTPPDNKNDNAQKMVGGDGPFGLVMGMTADMFNGSLNELKPGIYEATNVPTPNQDFAKYIVRIGSKSGLCWIKAIGHEIPTNSFGLQIRSRFDEMNARLTEKYGQGKLTDLLISGSIWNDSNDWMMALKKEERILAKEWNEKSKASLTSNLITVFLHVAASSTSEGRVNIEYAFSNEKECDKEISSGNSKGL